MLAIENSLHMFSELYADEVIEAGLTAEEQDGESDIISRLENLGYLYKK